MTASIHNSTYETCPICSIDFTDIERDDTKKVIELACKHFFHMSCLASWFDNRTKNSENLNCGYCTQLSIQKYGFPNSFTREYLINFFEEIKNDPLFESDHNIITCVAQLDSLLESLLDLLNDTHISDEGNLQIALDKFVLWIKANFKEELQCTASQIITEIVQGSNVGRTLKQRVRSFANIPHDKWPVEIEQFGLPVYHSVDGIQFRAKVSKEYVQREVASYLRERLQDRKLFHGYLEQLSRDYYYDDQVLQGIPHVKNLQKDFLPALQNNPTSSIEEILFLLQEAIKKMEIKDHLKETVRLIMTKFLFRRDALRTLKQEIKRWENTPSLPPILSMRVRVLDENDLTKSYIVNNFKEEMRNHSESYEKLTDAHWAERKNNAIWHGSLLPLSVGLLAKVLFNYVSKRL